MADKARRESTHKSAVEVVRKAESFSVDLPGIGKIPIPRPEQLAYLGGLAALAALEIIDWPVALAIGAGHALAQQHHNRVARELGEALQDA